MNEAEILIIGANGQLGKALQAQYPGAQAADVDELDITDKASVEKYDWSKVKVILNAAAYTNVDGAETAEGRVAAWMVNADAVANLVAAAAQNDITLVHISTDYVFDGTAARPYVEEDATHPLGAYAVSKLAGELYAQAYLDKVLIVRTSGVFGPGGLATARGNFVEMMLRMAGTNQPIRVVEDHCASPTYAPFLAARTADLLERGQSGVFHCGGGTPISWFDFAQIIFEVAGLQPALHRTSEREYRTPARRPKYSPLSNAKMESAGVARMPTLRQAVEEYFRERSRVTQK